jgi:hypothetical protein
MIEPTADHITLIRNAYWRWEDCEHGAPAIDCKRPFGNSDVAGDLAELLPHLTEDEREIVFRDLVAVIPVIAKGWSVAVVEPAASVQEELGELANIVEAMGMLPDEALPRILGYLNDRFGGTGEATT